MAPDSDNPAEIENLTGKSAVEIVDDNGKIAQIDIETDRDCSEQHRCGYGSCSPDSIQCFHNAKCLVICLSLIGACLGMVVNGLVPISITTLEKRFGLSSTDSGMFAGAYKLASMTTMMPVAYFGGRGHKGRFLGFGALSLAAGSTVICLSQFLSDPYEYGGGLYENNTDTAHTCQANSSTIHQLDTIHHDRHNALHGTSRWWFYVLVFGQLLHGCGGAPIVLLAVTFIDDNVSQMASPVYSSIFMACRNIVGPAAGYIFGGLSLKIYGDFMKVDMNSVDLLGPSDSRWYGAWWVGFVVSACLALLLAVPILGFGRRLPEANKHRAKDSQSNKHDSSHNFGRLARDIKKLIMNPTFTCVVLTQATEAFMVSILITFTPKIIESVFDYSSSSSSLISGGILMTGGLGGTLVGGYLIRRLRLKCPGIMKLAMLSAIVCAPCYFLFLFRCPQLPFAGQSIGYQDHKIPSSLNLNAVCNIGCACNDYYQPMCDTNTRISYYSPCHAGCTNYTKTQGYSSCNCVSTSIDGTYSLENGRCKQHCDWFYPFCVAYALFALATFTSNIPLQQTVLRSVEFPQRTLAMGIHFLVDGVATLTGAVIFGAAIDRLCVLWMGEAGGQSKKSCARYDADLLGPVVIAFGTILFCFQRLCYTSFMPIKSMGRLWAGLFATINQSLTLKLTGLFLLWIANHFYRAPIDDSHMANGDSVQYRNDECNEHEREPFTNNKAV